jgi:hypothetical protein
MEKYNKALSIALSTEFNGLEFQISQFLPGEGGVHLHMWMINWCCADGNGRPS